MRPNWTKQEDYCLLYYYVRYQNEWLLISEKLKTRSPRECCLRVAQLV
ncbi:1580_t:CDS:2 [Paraglomus brasilianum]|uniref:1580_t:CDS:1 n=1 Tax=Paraglomus brasilianum TaxID=144538 RepID=A0A9N9F134_9GLOM|nr:1580_t:CDS:2 [Paraglomus brasilianum]